MTAQTAAQSYRPLHIESRVRKAEFFRHVGYSTCWEDERIVSEGLAPKAGERVFSITSGGCFSLQFLLHDVAEVISLDFNPRQSALLALKQEAARRLSHDELWELMGLSPSRQRRALYASLRGRLPAYAREYWDAQRRVIDRGASLGGKQDRYFHWVGRLVTGLQGRKTVDVLLSSRDAEEQRRIYGERWNGLAWRALCDVVFSRAVLDRAFDREHFVYSSTRQPHRVLRDAVEQVLRDVPIRDNFYLHYVFRRTYPSAEVCPAWLRRSSLPVLRDRVDRLRIETGELERFIFSQPDDSLDCFNFSNLFDWVSQDVFERLMREVVRVARSGARLCYWTNAVNTRRELRPERLPEIREDRALSEAIFAANRTPGYSGCVIARITK